MSVSDPLLKELKGHAQHLVEVKNVIDDNNESVGKFCECLERIFHQGLSCTNYSNSFFRPTENWDWLEILADNRFGASYNYQTSVASVKECVKVRKNRGRSRLLIRTCLVKKCLHEPVKTLMCSSEWKNVFSRQSILGDEILCQILYSVLLWVGKLHFKLDLINARFLDDTWTLPETRKLELVPCKKLGVTVVFIKGKAVCYTIVPNSVAAEDDALEVGDIIDELNGRVINSYTQGNLNSIMRKSSGSPISIYVIKARHSTGVFPPIVPILNEAGIDPAKVRGTTIEEKIASESIKNDMKKLVITYIGHTSTGTLGDVKQICGAINHLLNGGENQVDKQVSFECLDLGVKVGDISSKNVLLKHSYMEISSCGCAVNIPFYFAYIAGDGNCSQSENFTCYVFHCNLQKEIDTILHSIGQGFKRTHYVV